MTLSQRRAYNEYMRKRYLRKQLNAGRVPQPVKPAPWLLQLYREFGVENAVYIPQEWMDKAMLKEIKAEQKRIRARVRDLLPAETSRQELDEVVQALAASTVIEKFKTA